MIVFVALAVGHYWCSFTEAVIAVYTCYIFAVAYAIETVTIGTIAMIAVFTFYFFPLLLLLLL